MGVSLWRLALFMAALSCLSLSSHTGGGTKAAYRNYYLGNYYFTEGVLPKALSYFRQAHASIPNQPTFGLAYALCLGENGEANKGLLVLESVGRHINPSQKDYLQQRLLWHHVKAIVASRAQQYGQAKRLIREAIQSQKNLDSTQYIRLAGMYHLAGYLEVLTQEATTSHAGLKPHIHIDWQDLERAYPLLEQARSLDSSRVDSRKSLQLLSDTLGRVPVLFSPAVIDENKVDRPPLDMAAYPHLPDHAEELLAFGAYDEVIFLLDISGSMVMEKIACTATDRFTIMREVALYLLDGLPENTKAGLATIGGNCEEEPKWWVATDSLSRKQLRWEIQYINPNGTTPLLTTLVKTPTLFQDSSSNRGIFFVSDGENVCSLNRLDICDWAASLVKQRITLNILTFLDRGISNAGAFAEYACLTEQSGGNIRYLDPISCSVNELDFDLVDRVQFNLPPLERVACRRGRRTPLWAVFSD